jgi:molybdopterin-guanine dinucleotide biosynthesis protein A
VRSGIVLVGGEARRAGGREKYFFSYDGRTFIERLLGILDTVVDEIIVVAKDPVQCARFAEFHHVRVIPDIRRGIGPIGGLHAGVREAKGDLVFVVACDMPCVHPGVIDLLFSRIDDYDAVIPTWNHDMLEPLHAVYRKAALVSYLESHTSLSLRAMVKSLHTRYLNVEEIRRIDPDLKTFTNINKIEELERFNGSSG